MSEKLTNDAVVDRAIGSIKGLRVDGGEVFLRDGQSTSVEVRDGDVENAITRGERGIGVRVLRGGHVGFAYTSDLSPDGIEECVTAAREIASGFASGITLLPKERSHGAIGPATQALTTGAPCYILGQTQGLRGWPLSTAIPHIGSRV